MPESILFLFHAKASFSCEEMQYVSGSHHTTGLTMSKNLDFSIFVESVESRLMLAARELMLGRQ